MTLRRIIDDLPIHEIVWAMKRVAIYARVSTDSQTVENHLQELHSVAGRHGWDVVAVHDEGISGTRGRDKRPGYDALLTGVTRRDYDMIACWSVDCLGRSLADLVGFLDEIRAKGVDLYLHQQGLDTSISAGRALFGMLSVFAEFERSMIRERIMAGLRRTSKKSGRKPMGDDRVAAIEGSLKDGLGIRATARAHGASPMTVTKIARSMEELAA